MANRTFQTKAEQEAYKLGLVDGARKTPAFTALDLSADKIRSTLRGRFRVNGIAGFRIDPRLNGSDGVLREIEAMMTPGARSIGESIVIVPEGGIALQTMGSVV